MTEYEKRQITNMREKNMPFSTIADSLSLSINTVKSYCQRYGITPYKPGKCKNCGTDIVLRKNCKPRQFCSDKCRTEWWSKHGRYEKTVYRLTCVACGTEFECRGNRKQKYCSRACYAAARIRKAVAND